MNKQKNHIIELTAKNHAGVMSHITGLFSRRVFNLEAILCVPEESRKVSKIFLLVKNDSRITQIIKQPEKLYDVLKVKLHPGQEYDLFSAVLAKKVNKR